MSKDDRSDIESSSDEEIYSNGGKSATQTIKAKDGGRTGGLNGDAHDHWAQPAKAETGDAVIYIHYADMALTEGPFEKMWIFFYY